MYLKRSYLGFILFTNAQVSVRGECVDDPTFLLADSPGLNCQFVRERITSKGDAICNLQVNSLGTTVADKCPNACNNCASVGRNNMMMPSKKQTPVRIKTSFPTIVATLLPPVNITVSPSAEAPKDGYPYECVDHGEDLPMLPKLYPNGSNTFIHTCEWVAENPDERCDTMCPCVKPIALKNHCRKTCSNCPGVPSATPSATPSVMISTTPSVAPSPNVTATDWDCEDQGDGKKVFDNQKNMGICEWAAINPNDRCEQACPCAEDVGTQVYELCPKTCGTCSTSTPSSAPSISPTLAPSASPTVCKDDECIVAGDNNTLVPLCEYAAADTSGRCDLSYDDTGLVRDYCRYTCFVCRPIVVECFDTGSDKQVFVPAFEKTVSICEWAAIFTSKRCLEKCPCREGEGCHGKLVSEICEKTCNDCQDPASLSSVPSASLSSVPSAAPSSSLTSVPSVVPSAAPSSSLTSVPSVAPSSKPSSMTSVPSATPSSSLTSAPSLFSSSKPTICNDNEDCYAVTDGHKIVKLCDWANEKRCKLSHAAYVQKGSLPKGAGPLVRDICKKKCEVCPS